MPELKFIEEANGRSLTGDVDGFILSIKGFVFGTGNVIEALSALPDQGSKFEDTDFTLNNFELGEIVDANLQKIRPPQFGNSQTFPTSGKACSVTLTYKTSSKDKTDEAEEFEIDIGAKEQHVIRFPGDVEHFPKERDEVGNFVNWDGERIEGSELLEPFVVVRKKFTIDALQSLDIHLLVEAIAKTNANGFMGFKPRELLCMGYNVVQRGKGLETKFDVTVIWHGNVASRQEFTTVEDEDHGVAEQDHVVDKDPWQFLWFHVNQKVTREEGKIGLDVYSGHLNTPYKEIQFSASGLPIIKKVRKGIARRFGDLPPTGPQKVFEAIFARRGKKKTDLIEPAPLLTE